MKDRGSQAVTTATEAAWARLREQYPWPSERPTIEPNPHGWHVHAHEWARLLRGHKAPVVLEVGAWCGRTSIHLLNMHPRLRLMALDRWAPDAPGIAPHWDRWIASGEMPAGATMVELYRANLWPWRARAVAIQGDSVEGIEYVAAAGLLPDVVYVDGDHSYAGARRDIEAALDFCPGAIICGDDFKPIKAWDKMGRAERMKILLNPKPPNGVKWAVQDVAAERGLKVEHAERCCLMWWRYA